MFQILLTKIELTPCFNKKNSNLQRKGVKARKASPFQGGEEVSSSDTRNYKVKSMN